MAYPSRLALSNTIFAFKLLMNGRGLGINRVINSRHPVLIHGPIEPPLEQPCTGVSQVLPVTSPPILKAGTNTLSLHAFGDEVDDTGVALSDIVLWWQQNL
jgi:hypothetical protein